MCPLVIAAIRICFTDRLGVMGYYFYPHFILLGLQLCFISLLSQRLETPHHRVMSSRLWQSNGNFTRQPAWDPRMHSLHTEIKMREILFLASTGCLHPSSSIFRTISLTIWRRFLLIKTGVNLIERGERDRGTEKGKRHRHIREGERYEREVNSLCESLLKLTPWSLLHIMSWTHDSCQ